jgi:polyferredoxin
LYDLNTNKQVEGAKKYIWLAVVFLVPFFGVLAYHLIGPSYISKTMKYAAIGGGLISYLLILILTAVISGLV